jgi:hypothetical protein
MSNMKAKAVVKRSVRNNALIAVLLVAATALSGASAQDRKVETIDATAMGTSTQMGKNVSVKVTITRFSTPEEKQLLVAAFKKKARTRGWLTRLRKLHLSGALPSLEQSVTTSVILR